MYAVILVVPLLLLFGLGFMAGVETRLDRDDLPEDTVDESSDASIDAEFQERAKVSV